MKLPVGLRGGPPLEMKLPLSRRGEAIMLPLRGEAIMLPLGFRGGEPAFDGEKSLGFKSAMTRLESSLYCDWPFPE